MQRKRYTGIVLSDQERTALERLAKVEGRHLSETMRELVRAEAKRRGLWPDAEHDMGVKENEFAR